MSNVPRGTGAEEYECLLRERVAGLHTARRKPTLEPIHALS